MEKMKDKPYSYNTYGNLEDLDNIDGKNLYEYYNKVLKEESTKEKGRAFVPPTLDQVKDAFVNCNYSSDPMEFWAHYTNCGWKLSGGRGAMMKDWKLAAYNWEKREKQFNRNAR